MGAVSRAYTATSSSVGLSNVAYTRYVVPLAVSATASYSMPTKLARAMLEAKAIKAAVNRCFIGNKLGGKSPIQKWISIA